MIYLSLKLFFVSLITVNIFSETVSNLHDKFTYFQLLECRDLHSRTKRHDTGQSGFSRVSFRSFAKTFHLLLRTGSPSVLADDFVAHAVHSNGSESRVLLDLTQFLHGTVLGTGNSSWVSVVRNGSGVWTAVIEVPFGTFYIEPVENHVGSWTRKESMVIYRTEHMKEFSSKASEGLIQGNAVKGANESDDGDESKHRNNGDTFCETIDVKLEIPQTNFIGVPVVRAYKNQQNNWTGSQTRNDYNIHRRRSGSAPKLSERFIRNAFDKARTRTRSRTRKKQPRSDRACDIIALGDYTLYAGIGKKNINTVVRHLIFVYTQVDRIFKRTAFMNVKGVRIVLSKMKIFTSPKNNDPLFGHYVDMDMDKKLMKAQDILAKLSHIEYLHSFCLAHFSTQRQLGGVLGVAYNVKYNPQSHQWFSGICSSDMSISSWNTGVSTIIDKGNKVLPARTYSRVVAHELGHNFGALHDDIYSDPQCKPSSYQGGKYLMWPRTTLSTNLNNDKFSPCSVRTVGPFLEKIGRRCMKSASAMIGNLCGNGVVDRTEDCDAGIGVHDSDPCCDQDCSFVHKAICSESNSPCCSPDCGVAPKTQTCTHGNKGDEDSECHEVSFCSGKDFSTCPIPSVKADGNRCGDGGHCENGRCLSLCTLVGRRMDPPVVLLPCDCDQDPVAMCQVCCTDLSGDRVCRPQQQVLHEGASCILGYCQKGVCHPTHQAAEYLPNIGESSRATNKNRPLIHTNAIPLIAIWSIIMFVLL